MYNQKIDRALDAPIKFPYDFREALDSAFVELRAKKVLALHHWYCCQSCGNAALTEDVQQGFMGGVFYHDQDVDSAITRHVLYLAWGLFGEYTDEDQVKFGHMVVDILRTHGLFVAWEGISSKRIAVCTVVV